MRLFYVDVFSRLQGLHRHPRMVRNRAVDVHEVDRRIGQHVGVLRVPFFDPQGVADSMQWMQRRGATTAMVNTALDNEAALALYAAAGFRRRTDTLTILELSGLGLSGSEST